MGTSRLEKDFREKIRQQARLESEKDEKNKEIKGITNSESSC